jgi:hypothetical protein
MNRLDYILNPTSDLLSVVCSSNYNTKACKHIKEKQHKHNKYVNVGEIFDQPEPYHLKSSDCFMKVQTTDKRLKILIQI